MSRGLVSLNEDEEYEDDPHFNLVGEGFWSCMDGMTEIEFFDDLYVKYLRLHASNNDALAS